MKRPRPYQTEAIRKAVACLERLKTCLLVMATGTGKTVVFNLIARDWPGRVLILAHRDELINQAAATVLDVLGDEPGVEAAARHSDEGGLPSLRKKIVVASVQTLCRASRLKRFDPATFSLVITDEAHHAVSRTYREIVEYFRAGNPELRHLGVTATPYRADKKALGEEKNGPYAAVPFSYPIADAVRDGWLVPVRQKIVLVDDLDFSAVKVRCGDFAADQLDQILSEEKMLHRVAAPAAEMLAGRRAVVFTAGVAQAEGLAAVFGRYGVKAAWLSGDRTLFPVERRRQLLDDYKAGKLQALVNCGVLTEGWDCPEAEVMVMARPTKSLGLYLQCLGRVTRPLKGVVDDCAEGDAATRHAAIAASAKPFALVLDYTGKADKFARQALNAFDALGGKDNAALRDRAVEIASEAGAAGISAEAALERAEAEAALERALALRKLEEERRRRIKAEAEYRTREVGVSAGPKRAGVAAGGPDPVAHWRGCVARAINFRRKAGAAVHFFKEKFGCPPWEVAELRGMLPSGKQWQLPAAEAFAAHSRGGAAG